MLRALFSALFLVALAACGGGGGGGSTTAPVTPPVTPPTTSGPYPTGLSDQTIVVGGTTRQYRVHVPATLSGAPKALVFVLHGGGGIGLGVAETGAHPLSVFRTVADREGLVVVYPGGLPASDGQEGWVDCRADDRASSDADDVGFLAALIEKVRAQYSLAPTRMLMAGGSNGAMMTQAFAIARPELVAAVASSGGALAANPRPGACAAGPKTPKPILLAHGTADTQMPYGGGCVANLGGNCTRGGVVSAEATRDRWLQVNGLAGVTPTQQVVEVDTSDGGPANRFDYAGAAPLRWWRLDGAGHTVASRSVLVQPNSTTGIQNRDIEFAEVAWQFFNERLTVTAVPSAERQVNATATDPAITAEPAGGEVPHVALNPSPAVNARGRLLVFLPGTQGRTTQTVYLLRAAAARGFHAIGLNYPNQTAMGTLCGTSADPECYWKARSAIVLGTGTMVPAQAPVAPGDSVVNRLSKLLAWLRAQQTAEGWGQYLLTDGTVDWSKVVVSGHSQGGGHAGVLAKTFALARACYFSSPQDWNETTDRADGWTANKPNTTPAARQYGFGSDSDTLVPNARASAHWDAFGMTRPAAGPLLVDGSAPPFSGSQQLRTALPPNPASAGVATVLRNHGLTVVDALTPIDGEGKPLFDSNGVWAYLCFQ